MEAGPQKQRHNRELARDAGTGNWAAAEVARRSQGAGGQSVSKDASARLPAHGSNDRICCNEEAGASWGMGGNALEATLAMGRAYLGR